jgi:hypothetical protein
VRNAGRLLEIDDCGRVDRAPPLVVRAEAVGVPWPVAELGGQVWEGRGRVAPCAAVEVEWWTS